MLYCNSVTQIEKKNDFIVRRLGFADALGIVAAVVAVGWLPGGADTLTPAKLLALAGGGACLAPGVVARWREMERRSWSVVVPCVSVVFILVWSLISIAGSSAPPWDALFGWWGRGDGWLAWLGAASLFLGAATLSVREVFRTISWLLGGASIVALIGVLQLVGFKPMPAVGGSVVGIMGNTNFAAGYFAILAPLALGRALCRVAMWQRVWAGVLFVTLVLLAAQTGAKQGPASLGAAIVAFVMVSAVLYRGKNRFAGLVAVAAVVVLGFVLVMLSFFEVGPLAILWSERSFTIRQEYWQTALNMIGGRPIFGTGPSGFARYVGEYRTEGYVEAVGPIIRVSAAHNIVLQFGAVLGFPGMMMWLVAFFGAAIALAVRVVRGSVASIGLTASVVGAVVAYLVQGMVSIDALPLLATGWLVAGLALSCAREQESGEERTESAASLSHQTSSTSRGRRDVRTRSMSRWVPITGGALGLVAALLVATQINLNYRLASGITSGEGLALVSDRMVPCAIRSDYASQLPASFPPDVVFTAIVQATEMDRRCPPMVQMAAEVAIRQRILQLAATYSADAVTFDPLLEKSWVLRGYYYLGAGDIPSAIEAATEATRVLALYPEKSVTQSSVDAIARLISAIQLVQG